MTTTDEAVLLDPLDKMQESMRNSTDVDTEEFSKFLNYRSNLNARAIVYKNFTDEDGNFRMERMGDKDKRILNTLSLLIAKYEKSFRDSPIFDKVVKEFDGDLPDFLKDTPRDAMGRWATIELIAGWYQNSAGDLFHYDGVVWDNVPAERNEELEFLGNG